MDFDSNTKRNIVIGMLVDIVSENDKDTQIITRGYVKKILSRSDNKKGVKIELTNGVIGHIKEILSIDKVKTENFIYYNKFFNSPQIFSIWMPKDRKYSVFEHKNLQNGKIEKIILLFTDEKTAKEFLKNQNFSNGCYSINSINRKKHIHENFKTLVVDYFRINGERKLSFEKLIEWEKKFKNLC